MSFFTDFPHTRGYDGDLGWLIEEYKRLHKLYLELEKRTKELEDLYETIPDEINKAVQAGLKTIEDALARFRVEMDAVKADVNAKIAQQQKLFNEMLQEFERLKAELLATYSSIFSIVNGKMLDMEVWVLGKLEQFSNSYPWYVDPSDGLTEPVQTILNHMWNMLSHGLNVAELEGMNINVAELESWKINVKELELWGRDLHWFDYWKNNMMISPFTGQLTDVREVVQMLANLHMDGVMVGTVEAQGFDVQALEDKNFNVYDVSWTRKWFDDYVAELAAG